MLAIHTNTSKSGEYLEINQFKCIEYHDFKDMYLIFWGHFDPPCINISPKAHVEQSYSYRNCANRTLGFY